MGVADPKAGHVGDEVAGVCHDGQRSPILGAITSRRPDPAWTFAPAANRLEGPMLNVSLPAAALGGLISFLSPCVLPLVPPYLSFLAGTTFDRLAAGDDRAVRRRALRGFLLFVAGSTTVFVLLGPPPWVLGQFARQYLQVLSTV